MHSECFLREGSNTASRYALTSVPLIDSHSVDSAPSEHLPKALRQIRELTIALLQMSLVRRQLYLGTIVIPVMLFTGAILEGQFGVPIFAFIPLSNVVIWFLIVTGNLAGHTIQPMAQMRKTIWPILLLTDIGFLGISFSLLFSLLWHSVFAVLVSLPGVMLFSVMAGFNMTDVLWLIPVVLSYAVLVTSLALIGSMLIQDHRYAPFPAIIISALLFLSPLGLVYLGRLLFGTAPPTWWDDVLVTGQTWYDLSLMGTLQWPNPRLSRPWLTGLVVLENLALSLPFFALGAWLFRSRDDVLREPGWIMSRIRGFRESPHLIFRFKKDRPRPWSSALRWKEFAYTTGGRPAAVLRGVLYGLAPVGVLIIGSNWWGTGWMFWAVIICVMASTVFAIEVLMMLSRIVASEIEAGTIEQLLLLPVSSHELLREKLKGGLMGMITPAICVAVMLMSMLSNVPLRSYSPSDWAAVCLVLLEVATHLILLGGIVLALSMLLPKKGTGFGFGFFAFMVFAYSLAGAVVGVTTVLGINRPGPAMFAVWSIHFCIVTAVTMILWRKMTGIFEKAAERAVLTSPSN